MSYPVRISIASLLAQLAIEHLRQARTAHDASQLEDEIRSGIGAQLNIAIALEGVGNEIAEKVFGSWQWDRLERVDTPLKWHLLSIQDNEKPPFDPGKEPLQSVQELFRIRNNYIAHAKAMDMGDEIIVISKDGVITRNATRDFIVPPGGTVLLGAAKPLELFNYAKSADLVSRGLKAIKALRSQLSVEGIDWVDNRETELKEITDRV